MRNDESAPSCVVQPPWQNSGKVLMGLRSEMHLDNNGAAGVVSETRALTVFLDRVSCGADEAGHAANKLLAEPENVGLLAREIGKKIYEFILKPVEDDEEIDTRLTLAQIGLDSPLAIELRRWCRLVFATTVDTFPHYLSYPPTKVQSC